LFNAAKMPKCCEGGRTYCSLASMINSSEAQVVFSGGEGDRGAGNDIVRHILKPKYKLAWRAVAVANKR